MKKAIGLSILSVIGIALMVWITSTQAFLAEKEIRKMEELNKFDDRNILLPTYAPFKIHAVKYDQLYSGRREIKDSEIVYVDIDDLNYLIPIIRYHSNDESNREMEVHISKSLDMKYIIYDEIINFGEGLKGFYRVYQTRQFFTWEQDGVLLNMGITTEDEEQLLSLEEIIKIAESFKKWNTGSGSLSQ